MNFALSNCRLVSRVYQHNLGRVPSQGDHSTKQDNQKPGQPKPGHTTVESLDLPLALRRCLTIASGPGGGHRPQPARAGAPRPIPDAHIRDSSLHWVPSTRPYNTTVCRSMGRAGGIVKSQGRPVTVLNGQQIAPDCWGNPLTCATGRPPSRAKNTSGQWPSFGALIFNTHTIGIHLIPDARSTSL